jgi:hypothetical protein
MAVEENQNLRSLWRSRAATLVCHTCTLLVVVALPPIVFEIIGSTSLQNIRGSGFLGGITYPLYAAYWITKLKYPRAKFMLLHLVFVLTVAFATAVTGGRSTPLSVAWLPSIAAILPLLGTAVSWSRGNRRLATTYALSSLAELPVGVLSSVVIIYGMAMSSVGGMRY